VWGARVETVPPGGFVVRCAGVRVAVPPSANREQSGLTANEKFAASLARVSGGRLLREPPAESPTGPLTESPGRAGPAVHATLLCSLAFLLLAAWIRSR